MSKNVLGAAAAAVLMAAACASVPVRPYPGRPAALAAPAYADPAAPGSYRPASFLYASPGNPRRPEYAEPAVATAPVDISAFYPDVDKRYWGYGSAAVPLNGKVWYPSDGAGPFPLVVCVHGNHEPREPSEFGYDYLGELLASRGYVFASIDENFLNGNSAGENDARGILLLEHAKAIFAWNDMPGAPLAGRLDTDKLILVGHSRGGEAVMHAARFNTMARYPEDASVVLDYGLPLLGVVAIAPAEGQYRPAGRKLMPGGVNMLILQGSLDGDVFPYMGLMFYNYAAPAPGRFKVSFWIQGANHAQFNTIWAAGQDPSPSFRSALLAAADQLRIARAAISAFVDLACGRPDAAAGFFDAPPAAYLPAADYRVQSAYGDDTVLADFEEDADPATAGLAGWTIDAAGFGLWTEAEQRIFPKEGPRASIMGLTGIANQNGSWNLRLAWGKPAAKLKPPAKPDPDERPAAAATDAAPAERRLRLAGPAVAAAALRFDISVDDLAAPGLLVRIGDLDGASVERPLSDYLDAAPLAGQWLPLAGAEPRTVFETVTLPLADFGAGAGFSSFELVAVGADGSIALDNFRFTPGVKP
jgi:hypothetical protein